MSPQSVTYVPALTKLLDEVVVNALDVRARGQSLTRLDVTIDAAAGVVMVGNDAATLPVVRHPDYEGVADPRLTGGRHGYGAKLANILSTRFSVSTTDPDRGLAYEQHWAENMRVREDPAVLPVDAAAAAHLLPPDWGEGVDAPVGGYTRVTPAERAAGAPGAVSYVNGIATHRGGSHVTAVADAVARRVSAEVARAARRAAAAGGGAGGGDDVGLLALVGASPPAPAAVRRHMLLFVDAVIDRPAFESQSKELLTTGGLTAAAVLPRRVLDAALAVAGLSVVGRNTYGAFPIRGKLLNVREVTLAKALKNVEVAALRRILGLGSPGTDYTRPGALKTLRYGRLMLMMDQDSDGSHIKGLVLNLLDRFWPSLLRVDPPFVEAFVTPLGGAATPAGHPDAARRLSVPDFVNSEMLRFSVEDNARSIPSAVDGLKPSQRKVLYAALRRRLTGAEMKVAQLAGYVAETTAYHHGEAALHQTIVRMAQGFVGARNLPLLEAGGQFGTRLAGGKDAASARYIYTRLSPLVRYLFPAADDAVLPRAVEDGEAVEPVAYVPVVPLVLVNGAAGIGTGWRCDVAGHHPRAVIAAPPPAGSVAYECRGVVTRLSPSVARISELPVATWTEQYRGVLRRLLADGVLTSVTRTSLMYLYDASGVMRRYPSPAAIIDAFVPVRLATYEARRAAQIAHVEAEVYLLRTPVWALTAEKAAALAAAAAAAADRLAGLRETTAAALWVADLDALDVAVRDYLADSDADDEASWTEPPLPTVMCLETVTPLDYGAFGLPKEHCAAAAAAAAPPAAAAGGAGVGGGGTWRAAAARGHPFMVGLSGVAAAPPSPPAPAAADAATSPPAPPPAPPAAAAADVEAANDIGVLLCLAAATRSAVADAAARGAFTPDLLVAVEAKATAAAALARRALGALSPPVELAAVMDPWAGDDDGVTRGGTTFSIKALVGVGNRAGAVGIGEGKADTAAAATERACRAAVRGLLPLPALTASGTLPHPVRGVYVRTEVRVWPSRRGAGVSANNVFAALFALGGVTDVGAKVLHGRGVANACKALMRALGEVRGADEVARTRGLGVAALGGRRR
ncbi:hypothetical protein I4F81_004064 [Pyropia yezoensis]|uniref:Uncharacterized protein n=1 Tax=Pyropia yezoensis TaxID=2788 RepID=A0ACC3BU49_PYRYE|nr:hypothetical protein I4F81_004064 [Neopyropia yezoensis]